MKFTIWINRNGKFAAIKKGLDLICTYAYLKSLGIHNGYIAVTANENPPEDSNPDLSAYFNYKHIKTISKHLTKGGIYGY